MGDTTASERQRVRVWFGEFPIVDQTTTAKAATAFAQGMGRRFAGLRVTIEDADHHRPGVAL
ncbi:hypothetical protein GCM10029976_042520 [Kribbella albertanoniae]|uniref:Uncharacterized protein n=1 Tax=Kribbella albertanoniae TaxID=1266829 RepID=A0A4R4QEM5_9ACTN|nr:hypothetical protein [Kribbella albertanoniae]TDC34036.1 hypothetical protein E1261_04845 [Kribbella albertanoniae]